MRLSTSEVESEDEDVTYERSRVLSGDVGEDVLVLQDLTKVSSFAIFALASSSNTVVLSQQFFHMSIVVSKACRYG